MLEFNSFCQIGYNKLKTNGNSSEEPVIAVIVTSGVPRAK